MSLKASEVIASIRATLDYPDPDKLKLQTIVLKLREKVDHYFNRANLTDRNWFLDSWQLDAMTNLDEYPVTAPNWGRPINCETLDDSDPQHIRREVEIIDLQDRNLRYEGPKMAVSGTFLGTKHSATSMAFYRTPETGLTVKITPMPGQEASYVFWFEPNRPIPASISGNLQFLDQFQNLLVSDCALSLLPYCRYQPDFTNALTLAINKDFQLYQETFEEYIQNDRQQSIDRKPLWGDSIAVTDDVGWF